MRKALTWAGGLTALYLLLAHATDGGKLIKSGAAGAVSLEKAFQGR